jgi:ABC-2 type transport system ATP-binding protein
MGSAIKVRELKKTFTVTQREKGLLGGIKSLLSPKTSQVEAVKGVNFDVQKGERVAFIGPNGAGKSTTIKMMSGILHPTSGEIEVLGHIPWVDRKALGYKIGTVFGQKSQLWYHLPARDTFNLLERIYDLEGSEYKARRDDLIEKFELSKIMDQTVRKMSLGQRMRCEIVASLLHKPEILFLDEPTIGLDITAKAVIRDLIKEQSERDGTTIFLTSHDTGDMERVCDRVMVINHGELLLDNPLGELRSTYIQSKLITLKTKEEIIDLALEGVETVESEAHKTVVKVDTQVTPVDQVIELALKQSRLRDITVEDPPMEEIVGAIYSGQGGV